MSTTKACKNHFPVLYYFVLQSLHKTRSSTSYYFVLQSLHKTLPSTTLYYKACTKHSPVLLCTTKLAQSTSQYYCVLKSLHKLFPSTSLYYKACAKHVPVLLCTTKHAQSTSQYYCTTKLAQTTSQYYFVLQSLHKTRSSITLYYKACTKHFPVLLCTAKLAQALPSTTVYYKACTNYFQVLLWPSNLDAAITMRSAETELQNAIELRATVSEIAAPKPDLDTKAEKKTISKHFLKGFLKGKLLAPKLQKSAGKWLSQPGCSHSNTIYNLQLQKTIVLRMQSRHQATLTQPFQCDLQPRLQETRSITHTGTTIVAKHIYRRNQTTAAAPAAHTRYLSSPPAATLHGKTQGFVLRLPPQNKAHATFMQPFQCDVQPQIQETHRTTHTASTHTASRTTSPLPIVTTSLRHHFPSSPLPFVTTSLPHHFPSSPPPFVTTSPPHHFPSSPLPFLTTSLRHHFPSSPLPIVPASLPHHSLSWHVWSKPLYEIASVMALHKTFYVWFFCWLDPQFYSQTMVLHDSAQSMGSGGGASEIPIL